MFERFTERARQVVVFAQDESRRLGHDHIGTEHLLLGLLREEEGLAARVLGAMDVTLEEVRAEVERIVGRGEAPATGQIPFTPGGKKTLELALREAIALGHNYIGTEHILLGLVRADEGVGAEILREHDADPERIRQAIIRMLSGSAPLHEAKPEPDDVELTSPPLAPEVLAELERLTQEKDAAVERQAFDEAASLRDAEHRLRSAAARLVAAWRRHTDEPM
ncbi:MAG: UvrB/UvrC motif-containing protein [Gaiella sp.]|nr:UvrB/UvrC motif-containing protein [Gaiella sp.]